MNKDQIEDEIIYSLKPEFIDLIIKKEKNHEFRRVTPKVLPKRIWFYVTAPVCQLVYLAEVGSPVVFPNRILEEGRGNQEFNQGKDPKEIAFPILSLYKIKKPLDLEYLRKNFDFTAPQGFVYLSRYPKLYDEVVIKIGVRRLW